MRSRHLLGATGMAFVAAVVAYFWGEVRALQLQEAAAHAAHCKAVQKEYGARFENSGDARVLPSRFDSSIEADAVSCFSERYRRT